MDVGRPRYPEAQHSSIEDSAADAEAMDINDTVNNDPISLQIQAGAVTVVHYIVINTAFACSAQTANTLHAVYKLLTL